MIDRFETFVTTIGAINRCIQKIKDTEMKALGLRGIHVMCLYCLGKAPGGLTASRLCDLCGEDKAAISRTLKELIAQGSIRSGAETGKRAYRSPVCLTEKGERAMAYISGRVETVLDVVSAGIDDPQRQSLYEMLRLISGNLREYLDDPHAHRVPQETTKARSKT